MKLIVNTDDDYESLLGQWSDLESGLAMALHHPDCAQEFVHRIAQYDRWMRELLLLDTDIGLYQLFQLAINSPAGYSTSHALVSAVLCQMIADAFSLSVQERDALVQAAFTMNIAMTGLQDQLTKQNTRPSPEQQSTINTHATEGTLILHRLGVTDPLWLEIVQLHHRKTAADEKPDTWSVARRLAYILSVVDRYAAMISPRQSREGRSTIESARHIMQDDATHQQTVAQTLVRLVGLYPPGTFVQLDSGEVAVVVNRGGAADLPNVAIVIGTQGSPVKPPRLHRTRSGKPIIKVALVAAAIQERIDHHLVLQLGREGT